MRLRTRLAGIAGAALALTPAFVLVTATPVAALDFVPTTVQIFGVRDCTGDTAQYNITWTVDTDSADPVDIVVIDAEPTGPTHVTPSTGQVSAGHDLVLVHTVDAHAGPIARVDLRATPSGTEEGFFIAVSAELGTNCEFGPEVQVRGVARCGDTGQATLTWTLTNSGPQAATVALTEVTPGGAVIPETFPLTVAAESTATVHQTITSTHEAGGTLIVFTATNPAVKDLTPTRILGRVGFDFCPARTPTPPPATEAAPPGLAVTGFPALTYAAVAALLIVAGVGLLLLGRRRRGEG